MAWTNAIVDLRTVLSDTSISKYCYRKRVFGEINGVNVTYKTLETRRINDFSTYASVWKNGILLPLADTVSDDSVTGEFSLLVAPIDGDVIEASYYYQWFVDSELTSFLEAAASWLGFNGQYTNLDSGLYTAAKYYAACEAFMNLASRFNQSWSDQYRLEDAPDSNKGQASAQYWKAAEDFRTRALQARDDFYKRQGRQLQPSWDFVQWP